MQSLVDCLGDGAAHHAEPSANGPKSTKPVDAVIICATADYHTEHIIRKHEQ